jgi:hypothetical protein
MARSTLGYRLAGGLFQRLVAAARKKKDCGKLRSYSKDYAGHAAKLSPANLVAYYGNDPLAGMDCPVSPTSPAAPPPTSPPTDPNGRKIPENDVGAGTGDTNPPPTSDGAYYGSPPAESPNIGSAYTSPAPTPDDPFGVPSLDPYVELSDYGLGEGDPMIPPIAGIDPRPPPPAKATGLPWWVWALGLAAAAGGFGAGRRRRRARA